MLVFAPWAHKGGVGKSTVAFCLACKAAGRQLSTLLVSCDLQGDAVRWAGGGDRPLCPDELFLSDLGFMTLYSPDRVPDLGELGDFDVVVVDLPPRAEAVRWVKPSVWIVPVDGTDAVTNTMAVLPALREQGGQVMWLPNNAGDGVAADERNFIEGLSKIKNTVLLSPIPQSFAVKRVAREYQPPWAVYRGKGTAGAVAMECVCDALLGVKPAGQVIRPKPVPVTGLGSRPLKAVSSKSGGRR